MKYTYSFIIPHQNSPELLNRCLNSIPQREDIQIIVVDDNSENGKRPNIKRKDVKIVYIDSAHTRGAGHARNIGLSYAQGSLLLFADCDDYYVDGFIEELDKYKDDKFDVLYFNFFTSHIGQENELVSNTPTNKIISDYKNDANGIDKIKFKNHVPWNKVVSNDFVSKNRIRFEEVRNGNDIMFSYAIGYKLNTFVVLDKCLYVYVKNSNSLSFKKFNRLDYLSKISNLVKKNAFLTYIGHKEWRASIILYCCHIWSHKGIFDFLKLVFVLISSWYSIYAGRNKYIKICIN